MKNQSRSKKTIKIILLSLGVLLATAALAGYFLLAPIYAASRLNNAFPSDGAEDVSSFIDAYNGYVNELDSVDTLAAFNVEKGAMFSAVDSLTEFNNQSKKSLESATLGMPLVGWSSDVKEAQSLRADSIAYFDASNKIASSIKDGVAADAKIYESIDKLESTSVSTNLESLSGVFVELADSMQAYCDSVGESFKDADTQKMQKALFDCKTQAVEPTRRAATAALSGDIAALESESAAFELYDADGTAFDFITDYINQNIADQFNLLIDRYNTNIQE